MKILIFSARDITHPWAGGAEVNIHEMMKRWIKKGHSVTMFCAQHYGGKRAKTEEFIDGMRIIRHGGRFTIYLLAPLYYWLKLRKYADIILDIDYGIPFFTPFFVFKPIVCIVNHIHGFTYFIEEKFPINVVGYFLETKIMPLIYRSKQFIAVSPSTKKELVHLGVSPKNISMIYNGIDHTQYNPKKGKFKLPTVIYVGRIRLYKRVDLLLRVFKKILDVIPKARLLIVGTGIDEKRLKALSRKLKLTKNVYFKGFVSEREKVSLMRRSWLFVTPSVMEGWGMTVIEANACGIPVVAFDVPGLRDSISNPHSGLLVKSEEDMEKAIIKVMKTKTLRKSMEKGALDWSKNFSWENSSSKYLRILDRAIQN